MSTWITIALRNIRLHWKHSLAAIISIASGFISLCMFQGYMNDVANVYVTTYSEAKMFGDIIVEHKLFQSVEGKSHPLLHALKKEEQLKIDQFLKDKSNDIDTSVRFLNLSGVISNGEEETIFVGRGYDLQAGLKMRGESWAWDTMYGLPLDQATNPASIVLGYNLGKYLGCKESVTVKLYDYNGGFKPENRAFTCKSPDVQLSIVTESGQLNAYDYSVSGLVDANYKEVDNRFIQLSLENAQALMDTDKVSYYTLRLEDPSDVKKFIADFNQYAISNHLDLNIQPWTEHTIGDMYIRSMDLLTVFRNFIVAIILTIAGLSIFNTMVKIVRERSKEIGTLRSLGFSKKAVTSIFMYEAFFLGLFGAVIGAVFSLVGTTVINLIGITYKAGILTQPVIFKIKSSGSLYILSFVILLTVTLFAAYIATRRMTNKKVIENLTQA